MDIGMTIKQLRRSKRMTQEELAEKLGITVQTVSRWENGINYPDLTMLPDLARLFEVTTDHLLGVKEAATSRKLVRTIETFEVDSPEEANKLIQEFRMMTFPKMTASHIEELPEKTIVTVEKEFGVDISEMKFNE